jgi:serine protease
MKLSRASFSRWFFGLTAGILMGGCDGADPGGPLGAALQVLPEQASPAGPRRIWVVASFGQREAVLGDVRATGGVIHYQFDDANAIVATVPAGAAEALARNPRVELVEDDPQRFPSAQSVPYGIDLVGARDVWDADRDGVVDAEAPTGAGRTICVIDSGLYTGHEDLSGVAVSGHSGNLSWDQDGCGHGTHVAGTIAALNNNSGVVGVSPGAASLYIVRVFGDNCGWAYSSDLVDAAKKCQAGGAHIISMSLGGGAKSVNEEQTFEQLSAAGILSVAAAGNSGTSQFSYPASYSTVISVAAIDSNEQVASFSQKNSQVDLAAPGVGVLSTVPWRVDASATVDGVTYSGTAMENAGQSPGVTGPLVSGGLCTTTGDWAGKVVLCERGSVTFFEKVSNVQSGGGVAAVIYNNVSGGFSGTFGSGSSSNIPAIGLSREDGLVLLEKLGLDTTVVNTNEKPGSGYEAWDGTSMATPHVSGVAALVWSSRPDASRLQVREALENTAKDLGPAGRDNAYGFGLVQATAAIQYLADLPPADATPPVISNVASAKLKGTKFSISWTTDEPARSEVRFTCCGTYTKSALVTSHSMTFNGSRGVLYEYFVASTDAAGNRATEGPFFHQN